MHSLFENLESRQMLSVTHSGTQVVVNGTAGNDVISLYQDAAANVLINDNGLLHSYHPSLVSQVVVHGLDGNDSITALSSLAKQLIAYGGNGNDAIRGGGAGDYLYGQEGNDVVDGRLGNDFLSGGNGIDHADFGAYSANLVLSLDNLWNDTGAGTDNIWFDVENITGGYGSDRITGNSANNLLQGGGGTDYLYGMDGNDILDGGVGGAAYYSQNTGNDWLFGGTGNDTLHASDWGNNSLYGDAGNDNLHGYNGADLLNGGLDSDALYGGAASDRLFGYTGVDYLYGQDGDDALYGQWDTDYQYGGNGNDQIFSGTGNDFAYGDAGNDKVFGEDGDDYLSGGLGNDELFGGAGADRLHGNDGDDILVSIDNATTDTLYGGNGYDSFWGDEDIVWWWTVSDTIGDATAFENARSVRKIRTFANGADRTLNGDNIADPTDAGATANFSNRPLFGSMGPHKNDIRQGGVGDCYFMVTLSATAKTNPDRIHKMMVSLGDGTFAVMYYNNGSQVFYRVDADLSVSGTNLVFAGLGHDQSLWAAIAEKAYTHHRNGANSYADINNGWMSETFADIGTTSTNVWSFSTGLALLNHAASELSAGKAVTYGVATAPAGAPLVSSHAYMVERVNYGWVFSGGAWAWQAISMTLRNPWGVDGAGNDGADDAYVTVNAAQALAGFWSIQSAFV